MQLFTFQGSPPLSEHATLIERQREWNRETASKLSKVQAEIDKADAIAGKAHMLLAKLKAAVALGDILSKASKERAERLQRDRKISNLRKSLGRSRDLKKSDGWKTLRFGQRWSIEQAEKEAVRRLAKLEGEQRALKSSRLRTDASSEAAKHRQAMFERGVTFDRMTR